MNYFLDTSALIKRYIAEPGSKEVRSLFRRRRHVSVCRLASAELAATVARRHREGFLTEEGRDEILARSEREFGQMTVVEVRATLLTRVIPLVLRRPLRAYDAVQLASALSLRAAGVAIDFWSADERLVEAARGEGLRASVVG